MVYIKKLTDPRLVNNGQQGSQFLDNGNTGIQGLQTPPPTQNVAPQPTQPDWLVNRQNNPMSLQNSISGGNGASAGSTKQTGLGNLAPKASNVAPINPIPKNTATKPITNSSQAPLQGTTGNYAGSNGNLQSAISKTQIDPSQYTSVVSTNQAKQAMVGANNQYNQDAQGIITDNAFQKADLDLANDQLRSTMKNADYVTKLTSGVQDQYRMGVKDPNQIAQNLGMSLDDVNKVIAGKGNEILQFSSEKMDELSKGYQRQTQDIDLQKKRALEDHESTKARVDQKYQWNIDDMERDFGLANQLARKMGAGSGAVLSSGYQEGLKSMKDQFNRGLQRLTINHDWDSEDLVKNKTRLLENIDINLDRLKYTHDNNIKNAKSSALGALQDLQSKYQISDTNMLKSLQSLESNYLANVNQIFQYDMNYMGKMMDMYNSEIDRVNNLEQYNLNMEQKKQTFAMQQQQDYMQMYANNPAMAGAMFPEMQANLETNVGVQQFNGLDLNKDIRNLASQYPGQARAKNNNSSGITWNANFDNPKPGTLAYALKQKGINYQKGTARPSAEGGNYVAFATIGDGVEAVRTLWEISAQKGQTIAQRLSNYSVAGYKIPGIDPNKKFSDLSKQDQDKLVLLQIQKESPGLYKLLTNGSTFAKATTPQYIEQAGFMDKFGNFNTDPTNPNNVSSSSQKVLNPDYQALQGGATGGANSSEQYAPLYKEYLNSGNTPAQGILKGMGMTAQQFAQQAQTWKGSQTAGISNIPEKSRTNIEQIRDKFIGSTTYKKAEQYAEVEQFVNNYNVNNSGGPEDINLIYAFAKVMDPDSVVREGEYATAQKYAQSWTDQFGVKINNVVGGKAVLTPSARADMLKTIQNRLKSGKATFDAMSKNYSSQIDKLAGYQGASQDFIVSPFVQSEDPSQLQSKIGQEFNFN